LSGIAGAGGNDATSTTEACIGLSPKCINDCFTDLKSYGEAICSNGAWYCLKGKLASSCPPRSCAITPDACCDHITGKRILNACGTDGYRPTCPDTTQETDKDFCVPDSISSSSDCGSLNGQSCIGPEVYYCYAPYVHCACHGTAAWECDFDTGP
jgi:hypothetical protein